MIRTLVVKAASTEEEFKIMTTKLLSSCRKIGKSNPADLILMDNGDVRSLGDNLPALGYKWRMDGNKYQLIMPDYGF
jgi:hypothetical protein